MGLFSLTGKVCAVAVAAVAVVLAATLALVDLDHLDSPVHGRLAWVLHKPNFLLSQIPDLSGKTYVVIGATHGIGYWTALHIAKAGGTVYTGCRDFSACRTTADRITAAAAAGRGGQAVALRIDLANRTSILAFAQAFVGASRRLDVLVLNAGLNSPIYTATPDGLEQTLGVNWIGGFYLQHLLQGTLEATGTPAGPARVVIVASNAHTVVSASDVAEPDFGLAATPERAATYTLVQMGLAYARSKLLNILHARALALRVAAAHSPVAVISLHPGFIRTNIAAAAIDQYVPLAWRAIAKAAVGAAFIALGAMDEEDGCITSLYAATAPEAAALNGAYLVPFGRRWAGSALSQDAALAERAWAVAEAAIESWPRL